MKRIKIDTAADLSDMFGGQTEFEVAVYLYGDAGDFEIIGAGHTVAEAVAEARAQLRRWRETAVAGVVVEPIAPCGCTTDEIRAGGCS
jgi:hypothetical protein